MKHETTSKRNASTATPAVNITPATVASMYLRANQVLELLPISRRCLSNWQRLRRIKFYRCGRTILFKRADIEDCLEQYAVNPIAEPRSPRQHVEPGTTTTEPPQRKRRMERFVSGAGA